MIIDINDNHKNLGKAMDLLQANDIEYKVYYPTGGSDIVVKVDSEVIGEVQAVTFDESKKTLILKVVIFNQIFSKREQQFKNIKSSTIECITKTEYDKYKYAKTFTGVKYEYAKASFSVDHTTLYQDFVFSYESCTNYEKLGD